MRARVAGLLIGTAILLALVLAWTGFSSLARQDSRAEEERDRSTPSAPRARATPTAEPPAPTRDLFVYAGAERSAPPSGRRWAPSTRPPSAPATPAPEAPPVRLVGFLQVEGQPAAAVVIDSTVELMRAGDEVRGYRALALDDGAGVLRLRTPDGQEIELTAPAP